MSQSLSEPRGATKRLRTQVAGPAGGTRKNKACPRSNFPLNSTEMPTVDGSSHVPRTPPAPKHLMTATRGWWNSVVQDYQLEGHHLRLLQAACEAWDRLQQAREILAADGLTTRTETGLKAHPCIAIERDSRLGFARLVRELDLDVEPPASARVGPPTLRSNRRH